MRRRLLGWATLVSGVWLCVAGILATRAVVESRSALREGQALLEAGQDARALQAFVRAATWYVPGNPYSERGLDQIRRLAHGAARDGDPAAALQAWRSLREALMTRRTVFAHPEDQLSEVDQHIIALLVSLPPAAADVGKSREEREAMHRRLLTQRRDPNPFFGLLGLLGFFVWVFASVAFVQRGFDEQGFLNRRSARRWATSAAIGFGAFILGLAAA